jgi:hypothetical protein
MPIDPAEFTAVADTRGWGILFQPRQPLESVIMTKLNGRSTGPPDRLPADEIICWSRMQSESGQGLAAIVRRKEAERRAGRGMFLWGIGNAPGAAPACLVRTGIEPPVIFSVMKTRPKIADTLPTLVLAWRRYVDTQGREQPLPLHCLVTSRGTMNNKAKARHYALVCRSDHPLSFGDFGPFDPGAYRNLSGTGAPVGTSQVTALIRRTGPEGTGSYRVNLRATLTQDLWVRLCDPVALSGPRLTAIDQINAQPSTSEWRELVSWVREGSSWAQTDLAYQPAFL